MIQSRLGNNLSNELCGKYRKGMSLTNSKGKYCFWAIHTHFISWMLVQKDVYQKLYYDCPQCTWCHEITCLRPCHLCRCRTLARTHVGTNAQSMWDPLVRLRTTPSASAPFVPEHDCEKLLYLLVSTDACRLLLIPHRPLLQWHVHGCLNLLCPCSGMY